MLNGLSRRSDTSQGPTVKVGETSRKSKPMEHNVSNAKSSL